MANSQATVVERYAEWVIRWRWPVLLLSVLGAIAIGYGAKFITFSTDYRVYFGPDNPQLIAFDEMEDIYSKSDSLLIAVARADGGQLFEPQAIKAIQKLTEAGWQLPFATRVDSITNFQNSRGQDDDLLVDDLVPSDMALTPENLAQARSAALAEPLLSNLLVNEDATATAVAVTFSMPMKSVFEVPEVMTAARELRDEVSAEFPELELRISGSVALNNAFSEAGQQDMMTLMPVMFTLVFIIMWLMLRSLAGLFGAFMVIVLSIMVAMGMTGFIGIGLTPPTAQSPSMIMTLAVADSIHVVYSMMAGMRRGMNKHEALVYSMRLNIMPVFITSVTTAVGFLTMNFSDSPPMWDLGNIVAMGVMAAFFFSVTTLPALLSMLPVQAREQRNLLDRYMDSFADFVVRRRWALLGSFSLLTVLLFAAIPLNTPNDRFTQYFGESIEFRQSTDWVDENLTGLYALSFNLDIGESNGVYSPEYMKNLERFERWLASQPNARNVTGLTHIMRRLNKNMHGDDPAYYKIPEDRELIAQYLLLYELSLPFGLDLTNMVNLDKSGTKMTVTLENIDSVGVRAFVERSQEWLQAEMPDMFGYAVSPAVMFSYISKRNIDSMKTGMVIALLGISILLVLALRSVKMGFISLLPNVAPMGIAFGVWALTVNEVIFTMSIATGMTLGIVVDATVHFLSKYLHARRVEGQDTQSAVRYAFTTVGGAIVVMNLVLLVGFIVLAQSAFAPNSSMAQITSLAIVAALITDLLLLPPLLMWLDTSRSKTIEGESAHVEA